MHVVVHVAVHQQQVALQVRGHRSRWRRSAKLSVLRTESRRSSPWYFSRPVDVVAAVVVIAGAADRHLEEVGIAQDRVGAGEAATGVTEDPDAIDVDEPDAGSRAA